MSLRPKKAGRVHMPARRCATRVAGPETLHKVMSSDSTLKIRCVACGHKVALSRDDAMRLFTPMACPYDIRRTARCTQCAARRVEVWI